MTDAKTAEQERAEQIFGEISSWWEQSDLDLNPGNRIYAWNCIESCLYYMAGVADEITEYEKPYLQNYVMAAMEDRAYFCQGKDFYEDILDQCITLAIDTNKYITEQDSKREYDCPGDCEHCTVCTFGKIKTEITNCHLQVMRWRSPNPGERFLGIV